MLFFYYLFYVTNLVLNIDMHFKSYLFLFLLPKVIESAVKIGYNGWVYEKLGNTERFTVKPHKVKCELHT